MRPPGNTDLASQEVKYVIPIRSASIVAIGLLLAACTPESGIGPGVAPVRGTVPDMHTGAPAGSDSGYSAYCDTHPSEGSCPPAPRN